MKMKEGRLEDPWKCVMNDCSNIFQLPWKLFTAHKLPGRTVLSLSPSHHPSDRPPSCPNGGVFSLFFEKEKERESEMAFRFIPLFYYFHFLVFVCFFSWRRAIHHKGGEQQQKPKLRSGRMIYLFPLLHFLPPFFSSSLLLSLSHVLEREKTEGGSKWGRRRGWRGTNRRKLAQIISGASCRKKVAVGNICFFPVQKRFGT